MAAVLSIPGIRLFGPAIRTRTNAFSALLLQEGSKQGDHASIIAEGKASNH
jgi:hypothetical protein